MCKCIAAVVMRPSPMRASAPPRREAVGTPVAIGPPRRGRPVGSAGLRSRDSAPPPVGEDAATAACALRGLRLAEWCGAIGSRSLPEGFNLQHRGSRPTWQTAEAIFEVPAAWANRREAAPRWVADQVPRLGPGDVDPFVFRLLAASHRRGAEVGCEQRKLAVEGATPR